jgi:hypothetical protein
VNADIETGFKWENTKLWHFWKGNVHILKKYTKGIKRNAYIKPFPLCLLALIFKIPVVTN